MPGGTRNRSEHEQHQDEPEQRSTAASAPSDLTDELWKVAEGVVQLAGLYFQCRQNEDAAYVANALILLMHLRRLQS